MLRLLTTIPLILAASICPLVPTASICYGRPDPSDRAIDFPDVPGYHTLVTDLHLHTVFSDGSVWPDIRVQEALRDGLDVIAVTDDVEYQPYRCCHASAEPNQSDSD